MKTDSLNIEQTGLLLRNDGKRRAKKNILL